MHFSLGVKSPYTSSKRAPFRPAPFGFTPVRCAGLEGFWIQPFGTGLLPWTLGRLVVARLVLIFALPQDFHVWVRVVSHVQTSCPSWDRGLSAGF